MFSSTLVLLLPLQSVLDIFKYLVFQTPTTFGILSLKNNILPDWGEVTLFKNKFSNTFPSIDEVP